MSEQTGNEMTGADARTTTLPAMAGDGWVNCAQGHGHWGRFGAAGLLPVHRGADGEAYVLLHHRGTETDQGDTWSLLGGARDSSESAAEAAVREAVEESDFDPTGIRVERVIRDDHGGWSYDTVIVSVDQRMAVRPVDDESLALAWVPLGEVLSINLHPGFAASWPTVRTALDSVLNGEPSQSVASPSDVALARPPHPVTGAHVVASEGLDRGDGIMKRELVTFNDGSRAVYEEYERAEDVTERLLDAYVGRAVGSRVPLSHPVGPHQLYRDHMPGSPASTRHQNLAELADQGAVSTRDGVFLGLHHALAATQGLTIDHVALGGRQSLITVDEGVRGRGSLPDPANPFVATFFRQVEPHLFAWVDNPVAPTDIEIMRRHLEGLRPLFEHVDRTPLHNTVMERFGQVAEHATGTEPLLAQPPGHHVEMPVPAVEAHHPLPPPPGSQERADHLRVGEALLTDDGRISSTPQAKTIAIRAIAARMRSSTPELVLASMGLNIGNDMADHLGDGRYVLVPHNAQYPSMGADVRHVDELDPDSPQHALDKVVPMDTHGGRHTLRT
ncbi:NUDIX hydrolase [Streptomyces sp. NPDC091259]|uniref:NUDIX hydrolase n=1 Tax=Streptomyces sp. NPDC091259 TaxID=3365976 RepID=UPI0037F52042